MTKPNELLACPFDNGTVELWTEAAFHYGDRGYSPKKEHITCKTCGTRKTLMGDEFTAQDAIAAWNTRTVPMQGDVDARRIQAHSVATVDQFENGIFWGISYALGYCEKPEFNPSPLPQPVALSEGQIYEILSKDARVIKTVEKRDMGLRNSDAILIDCAAAIRAHITKR